MLEQLFGSKTRVRLLRLFLNNPGEPFFVRELTRRIGAQINAIRMELKNLQEMELIVETEAPVEASDDTEAPVEADGGAEKGVKAAKGRTAKGTRRTSIGQRKYFRLNPESLMYPELAALFAKSRVVLEKDFVRRLASVGSISYLVLTGTFTGDGSAPTDILIVGKVNRDRLSSLIRTFEKETGKELNYTVMTVQEFRHRKDVTDRFLYSVLESKKMTVIDTIGQ